MSAKPPTETSPLTWRPVASPTTSAGTSALADPGPPPKQASAAEQMGWRLTTPEGKAFYGRRKATVETVFGIIKGAIGFRQFSLRGRRKVAGEWDLVKCAYNLKRMHALAS